MQHALVADARRTRLAGVYTRHDQDTLCHLVRRLAQTRQIVQHRSLIVRGARSHQKQQTVVLSAQNILDFLIFLLSETRKRLVDRIHLLDLLRDRQLAPEFHIHIVSSKLLPLLLHLFRIGSLYFFAMRRFPCIRCFRCGLRLFLIEQLSSCRRLAHHLTNPLCVALHEHTLQL